MTKRAVESTVRAAEAVVRGVKERLPVQYFVVYEGSLLYSRKYKRGTFAVVLVGIQYGLVGARFDIPDDNPAAIRATVDIVVAQLLPRNPPQ